jgi:hypothetical protein
VINGKELRKKLDQHAQETEERNARSRAVYGLQEAPPARPRVSAYRGEGFDDFGDLLASGCFTRLLTRDDGTGGATWTLKAVLEARGHSLPVYMHGHVKNVADLPAVIDRLLRKGDWHEDKHPAK